MMRQMESKRQLFDRHEEGNFGDFRCRRTAPQAAHLRNKSSTTKNNQGGCTLMKKFLTVLAVVALVAFAAPAFAANPFMDVPAGHWAYDAVAQLAADGIISGYPDGAFKGAQPATRYEVASMVARALAKVDMDKASKQDLEMLKKLVMEFKDELDALGVKVDGLDKRVAVLEDKLGGWKLRGTFWFDASFAGGDQDSTKYSESGNDNEFRKERFRLTLTKQIDENTSFYAQFRTGTSGSGGETGLGDESFNIRDVNVTTKLPWDINFKVGRFIYDPEGDHGLYVDNDAIFGDYRMDGFQFQKSWGNFTGTAWIGRNLSNKDGNSSKAPKIVGEYGDYMNYAIDLFWQANEKFFIGGGANWLEADAGTPDDNDVEVKTYNAYASFNFTPSIALQGIYYWQDLDEYTANGYEDSPKAWKAVLDFKQDLLKFTALRVEYQQMDNNFNGVNDPYNLGVDTGCVASIMDNSVRSDKDNTSKMWFAIANQKWNDKWSSFLRYAHVDYDTDDLDDASEWGVGVQYQYTPAIAFRLAYDQVDYGDDMLNKYTDKDHVVQFRTVVNF